MRLDINVLPVTWISLVTHPIENISIPSGVRVSAQNAADVSLVLRELRHLNDPRSGPGPDTSDAITVRVMLKEKQARRRELWIPKGRDL